MKYLLSGIIAALFITAQAIAEDEKTTEKSPESGKTYKKSKNRKKTPEQWRILQEISEEERSRLRKLYASDPKAFRKELAQIVSRLKREEKELDRQIRALVQKYKAAKDADEKKQAYEELRKLTRKVFMNKMEKNRKRLESLEAHVKKIRGQYEFRQKNAEKIIQARLDALTNDMDFEW
ncbi:MAG: hypothetical protein WC082_05770 [Victivallales bacterium]|jgi:aminopeptidase N